MKTPDKKLRNKIMCDIVYQYRENQKKKQKLEKVNLFPIWKNYNMTYSSFIDIILYLESKGYINYSNEYKSDQEIKANGEIIHQEFVSIIPKYLSYPEDLIDSKNKELKTNLIYPTILKIILMIITALVPLLLSIDWICNLIKWILSLFHF